MECQMYAKSPAAQNFLQLPTNNFFTNRFCYVQNFTTAPGFVNPGFDVESSKFLQPWTRIAQGGVLPSRKSPGYQSSYAAVLSVGTQISQTSSELKQNFMVCPHITYTITPLSKYLGANGTSLSIIKASFGNLDSKFSSSCSATTSDSVSIGEVTGEWTTFNIIRYKDCYGETGGACDDPNCDCYDPPTYTVPFKFGLIGSQISGAFQVNVAAGYCPSDDPSQSPRLDKYLVDFLVERSPTPPDVNDSGSCSVGDPAGYDYE